MSRIVTILLIIISPEKKGADQQPPSVIRNDIVIHYLTSLLLLILRNAVYAPYAEYYECPKSLISKLFRICRVDRTYRLHTCY